MKDKKLTFKKNELSVLNCYLQKQPFGGCCGGESPDCCGYDVLTKAIKKSKIIFDKLKIK